MSLSPMPAKTSKKDGIMSWIVLAQSVFYAFGVFEHQSPAEGVHGN